MDLRAQRGHYPTAPRIQFDTSYASIFGGRENLSRRSFSRERWRGSAGKRSDSRESNASFRGAGGETNGGSCSETRRCRLISLFPRVRPTLASVPPDRESQPDPLVGSEETTRGTSAPPPSSFNLLSPLLRLEPPTLQIWEI